jgi:4-amino-4-deoxy-L-arabinose transferase-like glycosyltransferase
MTKPASSIFQWLRSYRCALTVVLLFTALTRVSVILALRTDRSDPGAYEHAEIARAIVAHRGFLFAFFSPQPELTSYQAPAIPLLLAGAYKITATDSQAYLLLQLVNVVLALATSAALIWLGTTMWRQTVGLAAGFVLALYPPLIYMATRVQAANWSVTFFVLAIAATFAVAQGWTRRRGALLGVVGALGILGEPILAAPLAAAWLLLGWAMVRTPTPERRRRVAVLVFALLAALLVLLPWSIRNYQAHGRLVPVKSTFWYVFWQGNHLQSTGTDKLTLSPELADKLAWRLGFGGLDAELEAARQQAQSVDSHLTPEELHELADLPDEMARVDWFKARILSTLSEHPGHYLRLCAVRLWQLLWFDSTNPRALVLPYRGSWLVLAVAALLGCALARRDPPRRGVILLAMVLALAGAHVAVIMSSRFRLPLEAALTLVAGLAFASTTRAVFPNLER